MRLLLIFQNKKLIWIETPRHWQQQLTNIKKTCKKKIYNQKLNLILMTLCFDFSHSKETTNYNTQHLILVEVNKNQARKRYFWLLIRIIILFYKIVFHYTENRYYDKYTINTTHWLMFGIFTMYAWMAERVEMW